MRAVPREELTLGTARTGTSGLTRPGQRRPLPEQGFRLELQTATRPTAGRRSDRNKAHGVAIVVEENHHVSVRVEYGDVPRITDVLRMDQTLSLNGANISIPASRVIAFTRMEEKDAIVAPRKPINLIPVRRERENMAPLDNELRRHRIRVATGEG